MEGHFLRDLEFLGVTARLKRLSDVLTTNIKDLYLANGVDIEPSWHLVFLFLKQHGSATMTEIATSLQLSQPAMVKMINRMIAKEYLDVVPDDDDGRKKNIRLSARARNHLPVFERIWAAGQESIKDIVDAQTAILTHLEYLEEQIRVKSFKDRAMEHLNAVEHIDND